MDVTGTITIDDAAALAGLSASLRRGDCAVAPVDGRTIDFRFPWGTPAADEALEHAWREVVFFLRSWEAEHPRLTIKLQDVHFEPSHGRLPTADAA